MILMLMVVMVVGIEARVRADFNIAGVIEGEEEEVEVAAVVLMMMMTTTMMMMTEVAIAVTAARNRI